MKKTKYTVCVVLLIIAVSCGTFQTAKVLEKGEQTLTAGLTNTFYPEVSLIAPELDVLFRSYLAPRVDFGIQLTIPGLNLIGDIKYQILTEPLYLAAGLGAGLSFLEVDFNPPEDESGLYFNLVSLTLQGLIVAGTDKFYVGLKPLYSIGLGDSLYPLEGFYPHIFAGLPIRLGKVIKLIIELDWPMARISDTEGLDANQLLITPTLGVGVMFTF